MIETTRNDSLPLRVLVVTHHCESFASASLTICKDSTVEAFKCIFYKREPARPVNFLLTGLYAEDIVKDKILDVCPFFDAEDVFLGLDTEWRVHFSLSFVEWSDSKCHLDRLVFVGFH